MTSATLGALLSEPEGVSSDSPTSSSGSKPNVNRKKKKIV